MNNFDSKSKSNIREADKRAVRLLCSTFNESMRNGKDFRAALLNMIDSQKKNIPELKGLDSKSVLAGHNLQMNVLLPKEIRVRTSQLISYLLKKQINPRLEAPDIFMLDIFIDDELIQLSEWQNS
jgi:hypothetical protein